MRNLVFFSIMSIFLSSCDIFQAIAKAMKNHQTEKPGKVYVTTRKTKSGSMGSSAGGKQKVSVRVSFQ